MIPMMTNSLPHNLIQSIYLDPDEPLIWLGTYEGLSCFDLDKEDLPKLTSDTREGNGPVQ